MDKPISMSVKEYLLRIMSVNTNIPEKTIEAVVENQFEGVLKAMQEPGIHSIEVSGFGKFLFNEKKALYKWQKHINKEVFYTKALEDPEMSEAKKRSYGLKLADAISWLEKSKPKIDGIKQVSGGVEEQATPKEGVGRTDLSGKIESMSGM